MIKGQFIFRCVVWLFLMGLVVNGILAWILPLLGLPYFLSFYAAFNLWLGVYLVISMGYGLAIWLF